MVTAGGDLLLAASRIHMEADELLRSTGLLSLLAQYGAVHATGSYAYNLMMWRDVDLCVAAENLSVARMFRLGPALAQLPNVGSICYRNQFVMKTPGNPLAVFWCVDFYLPGQEKWKIDVLVAGPEEVRRVLLPGERLHERLTPEARAAILRIKGVVSHRPAYHREYGSLAIYRAVIEHGISTVEKRDHWWALQQA